MPRPPVGQLRPFLPDILALRDRGLGYRAIAQALGHFRGVDTTYGQVAYAVKVYLAEEKIAYRQRFGEANARTRVAA